MYQDQFVFSQIMEHLPWTTLTDACNATKATARFARFDAHSSFAPWPSHN